MYFFSQCVRHGDNSAFTNWKDIADSVAIKKFYWNWNLLLENLPCPSDKINSTGILFLYYQKTRKMKKELYEKESYDVLFKVSTQFPPLQLNTEFQEIHERNVTSREWLLQQLQSGRAGRSTLEVGVDSVSEQLTQFVLMYAGKFSGCECLSLLFSRCGSIGSFVTSARAVAGWLCSPFASSSSSSNFKIAR